MSLCTRELCTLGVGNTVCWEHLRQEEKLQLANSCIRRICKVIGIKKHLKMKVGVSKLRWAGHIERMSEKRLT